MKLVRFAAAALAGPSFALCGAAIAQDAPKTAWSGEGALNAGFTTGNTDTRDAGVSLKLKRQGLLWTHSGDIAFDYGETNNVETKNRFASNGQIDRNFGPRWAGYGRATYERNDFSGFENRYFLGFGASWKAIVSESTNWTIEGGPGYKIDEVRATATVPASREDSVSGRLGSKFKHAFNPNVTLSNDSEVVTSDVTTQLQNTVALTAKLMGNLNARVSLDVRHETQPRPGFEPTDTATKFSLVYKVP